MKRTSRLTSFFLAFVMMVTTFGGAFPLLEVNIAASDVISILLKSRICNKLFI
jgi:hypothetical protein